MKGSQGSHLNCSKWQDTLSTGRDEKDMPGVEQAEKP